MKTADKLVEIVGQILDDGRYLEGLTYGVPRAGHDEGSVANHIFELRQNLEKLTGMLSEEEYLKLLILIHVHDAFKLEGKRLANNHQVSLRDPRSHAMLARKFLSEFTDDESLLSIVQWHDEGHALWKQVETKGKYNEARLKEFLQHMVDLELFLLFTVIDGYTKSKLKDRSPVWFLNVVYNHCVPPKLYRAYDALLLLEQA